MTKTEAALELIYEASVDRRSTTAAKRVVRACGVLGLDAAGTLAVMQRLQYARRDGAPYNGKIAQVWQIPATTN